MISSIEAKEWRKYKNWYQQDRLVNVVSRKIFHHEIKRNGTRSGKENIAQQEFTKIMIEAINSDTPFMAARYGSVEATMLFMSLGKRNGAIDKIPDKCVSELYVNAGFFPINDLMIERYTNLMLESSMQIDVLGYWNTGYQEYLVDKCCPASMKIVDLGNFQPYQAKDENIWTAALEGKRVLVIHPFAESIESQYQRREKLWKNQYILPRFDLKTIKAVQTIAGQKDDRFDNWFEALDYMTQEALKDDFDIAIIACGAYGMPLSANLKKAGKTVLHWGGISQIWFGIKGSRWDNNPKINQYYNEFWVRPSDGEKPKQNQQVEGGCYW